LRNGTQLWTDSTVVEVEGIEMALTDLAEDLEKQASITNDLNRYIWRSTIKPLINDDIVEEHARNPLGKHSPALGMVLNFLRSDPVPQKPRLVVIILKPEKEWGIGEHTRQKNVNIRVRPGTFTSVDEIEHAIFLERLKDAQEVYG
jgi:hypothetical protein